ncbi:unnamed protein product [Phytophthora fragariaefolia]|uniref:Unnamed protein product n=1 Tax=Phytophthora fragariaefolia TaxID=1490495 RepID=A0A9W6WTK6_9STRA|nr:unnamed protein product [Phytophthora fragariaefolia]
MRHEEPRILKASERGGFYEASLPLDVRRLRSAREDGVDDALLKLLELVLAAVVQCAAKEKFVKDILTMEDAVQADLMAIIEKVMARGPAIWTDADAAEKEQREEKATTSPGMGSPLYLSRNAALEQAKRENGVLKEENIHLAGELKLLTAKCNEIDSDRKELVETVRRLKRQADADALRKERSTRALYDERIQALQLELDTVKVDLLEKAELANQVPALQDEVDLLRPMAEKITKMDAVIAKYKAKIDELSGAKDILRVRYACLIASELDALLAHERQDLAAVREDLATTQVVLEETKNLYAQLQESLGKKTDHDSSEILAASGPTMAGGISEFNPELMEKLTRLEHENTELKKQIDGETSARIDSLLDNIEDLSRLKKSFEIKYFDTRQALQVTQTELKTTKERLENSITESQTRILVEVEWKSCLEEDVSSHASEKQALVKERDQLTLKLFQSVEREQQLKQSLSSRQRELAVQQNANEALTWRYGQLRQQHEYLAKVKDDLEARLVQQIACTGMQLEDAAAEQIRLQERKARELSEVCRRCNEQVADTISRMTLQIDAKSAEVDTLTVKIRNNKVKHEAERQQLEATNLSTIQELERYQELHSVSNTDWSKKEDALNNRVKELEKWGSECKQQEETLKSTIKNQLQSNARLVEKNKAMKADIVKKRQMLLTLENTLTRMESKVALLEKERAHFSSQEERKRDVESGMSTFSSQLSTQINLMTTEMEKVLKENKELNVKLAGCRCALQTPHHQGGSDSAQKSKNYYLTRIQQLEHDRHQVDYKRRELLLVNAKLIQEQKQLHVKNVSLLNEVGNIQESLNHWRLREERRKTKEGNQQSPSRFARGPASELTTNDLLAKLNERKDTPKPEIDSEDQKVAPTPASSTTRDQDAFPTPVSDRAHQSNHNTPKSHGRSKRKLEATYTTPETVQPTPSSTCTAAATDADFADAKDFFSSKSSVPQTAYSSVPSSSERRSKRRLSRFITRNLSSNEQSERPSECKQQ